MRRGAQLSTWQHEVSKRSSIHSMGLRKAKVNVMIERSGGMFRMVWKLVSMDDQVEEPSVLLESAFVCLNVQVRSQYILK